MTDPAQVVFALFGVNDANIGDVSGGPWQTIANYRSEFAALGPTGANKIQVIGDEVPTGLAQSYSSKNATNNGDAEVHKIPSSTTTCGTLTNAYCLTMSKSAYWFDTQRAFFVPCGTATSGSTDNTCGTAGTGQFVAGSNDGLLLAYCNAACWTGAGNALPANSGATHYFGDHATAATIPAGVYLFNAADAGLKVAVDYRWTNSGHGVWLAAMHDWLAASASSGSPCAASGTFVGSVSGWTLPAPAANCPLVYPWVHVASTWAAAVDATAADAANGGIFDYPAPWMLYDGLHPLPWGGQVLAKAMLNGVPSGALPTQQFAPPSGGAMVILTTAGTTNATGNYTSSVCNTTNYPSLSAYMNATGPLKTYTLSGVAPMASGLYTIGSQVFFNNTSSGLPLTGSHVLCVDPSANYVVLDRAATAVWAEGNNAYVANDASTLLPWGQINYTSGTNTAAAVTGCTTGNCWTGAQLSTLLGTTVQRGVMQGWALAIDSGSQTALANGSLGYGFGIEQNGLGDGYDNFVQVLSGYSGTAVGTSTFNIGVGAGPKSTIAQGDVYRMSCEVVISAGPNGRLTGLEGVNVKLIEVVGSSYAFVPPGLSSGSYTTWAGSMGAGSTSVAAFADASLAPGAPNVSSGRLTLNLVSAPVVMKSPGSDASYTLTAYIYTYWQPYDPVSATVRVRRCKVFKSTL